MHVSPVLVPPKITLRFNDCAALLITKQDQIKCQSSHKAQSHGVYELPIGTRG